MAKKIIIRLLLFIRLIKYVYNKYAVNNYSEKSYIPNSFDKFYQDEMNDCYNHFKKYFYSASFVPSENIRDFSIKTVMKEFPDFKEDKFYFLEFGVFKGSSTRNFAKILNLKKLYAFDSFYGLNENWVGQNGYFEKFNLEGKIPSLGKNVVAIKGWVEDTLDTFIDNHLKKIVNGGGGIIFIHLDLDTYGPTKFVLSKLKKYFIKNTIIIFDELYNYSGWKNGEYKALTETLKEGIDFKFISFSSNGQQAVIRII
jgi:hypothetical protein